MADGHGHEVSHQNGLGLIGGKSPPMRRIAPPQAGHAGMSFRQPDCEPAAASTESDAAPSRDGRPLRRARRSSIFWARRPLARKP